MKKLLILLVGETGSGKDTVANMLSYDKVVSYTDRPARSEDVQGVHHYFLSKAGMDAKLGLYRPLAYTQIGEYRYCAFKEQLINDVTVYVINPDGVKWMKEHYKGNDIKILTIGLYLPLSERAERCKDRSDFNNAFYKRVADEQREFDNFRLNGEFDYLIKNNDSKKTASIINTIVCKEMAYMEKEERQSQLLSDRITIYCFS